MVDIIALFSKHEYPDKLTKKHWDKKKSLAGKALIKKTGVGEALDTLETFFKRVDWDAYDMQKIPSGRSATMDLSRFDEDVKQVILEMKSGLSSVHDAMTVAQDHLDEAIKRFKAAKVLGSDVKLSEDLIKEIKALRSTYDIKDLAVAMLEHAAGTKKGFGELLKKGKIVLAKAVKEAETEMGVIFNLEKPTPEQFNKASRGTRSAAMNLRNAVEGSKAGLTAAYSPKIAEELYKKLVPFYTGHTFKDDVKPELVKKGAEVVLKILAEVKKLTL
jgi:hypothetical protein